MMVPPCVCLASDSCDCLELLHNLHIIESNSCARFCILLNLKSFYRIEAQICENLDGHCDVAAYVDKVSHLDNLSLCSATSLPSASMSGIIRSPWVLILPM